MIPQDIQNTPLRTVELVNALIKQHFVQQTAKMLFDQGDLHAYFSIRHMRPRLDSLICSPI